MAYTSSPRAFYRLESEFKGSERLIAALKSGENFIITMFTSSPTTMRYLLYSIKRDSNILPFKVKIMGRKITVSRALQTKEISYQDRRPDLGLPGLGDSGGSTAPPSGKKIYTGPASLRPSEIEDNPDLASIIPEGEEGEKEDGRESEDGHGKGEVD